MLPGDLLICLYFALCLLVIVFALCIELQHSGGHHSVGAGQALGWVGGVDEADEFVRDISQVWPAVGSGRIRWEGSQQCLEADGADDLLVRGRAGRHRPRRDLGCSRGGAEAEKKSRAFQVSISLHDHDSASV